MALQDAATGRPLPPPPVTEDGPPENAREALTALRRGAWAIIGATGERLRAEAGSIRSQSGDPRVSSERSPQVCVPVGPQPPLGVTISHSNGWAGVKAPTVLRWIALAPAATGASMLVGAIVSFGNRLMPNFIDPDAFLLQVWIQFASGVASGAALVFVAVYVAPSHKSAVAVVAVGSGLLLTGAVLMAGLLAEDYWAIWNAAAFVGGMIGVAAGEIGEQPGG